MNDFNRKVEDASARVGKTINDAAERLEQGNPGIHQVPERRGRARGSFAFDQGSARSFGEAHRVRRLHGKASGNHRQVASRSRWPPEASVCEPCSEGCGCAFVVGFVVRCVARSAMTVVLLITLLLLIACGHPKQARVEVPPSAVAGERARRPRTVIVVSARQELSAAPQRQR